MFYKTTLINSNTNTNTSTRIKEKIYSTSRKTTEMVIIAIKIIVGISELGKGTRSKLRVVINFQPSTLMQFNARSFIRSKSNKR
jgi:hypothetical protein